MNFKCVKCSKIFSYQTYRLQKCNECKAEDKLLRREKRKQEVNSVEYKEKLLKSKEESRKKILEANVLKSHLKYPDWSDPYTFVECTFCTLRSADIGTHIKMHGISVKEYKEKHGPIRSQSNLDLFRGENNPAYNHGGRLSPFSKKFVKYTSDEDIDTLIRNCVEKSQITKSKNHNDNTKIDYYTSRGYSLEESKKLLSERQTTFTLEKCIERHGEVEGYKVWKERQDGWQESMKDKSSEEIARINALKSTKYTFQNLWRNEMTDPGNFYILEIVQGTYKIGVTTKSIEERHAFLKNKNNKIKVKLFQKMEDISHAFRVEQLVKRKFLHTITNEDYDMKDKIGWTEVVRVDYDTVLNEANKYIKDVELSITDFNNIRKKKTI